MFKIARPGNNTLLALLQHTNMPCGLEPKHTTQTMKLQQAREQIEHGGEEAEDSTKQWQCVQSTKQ
jgi:hypothetical protein